MATNKVQHWKALLVVVLLAAFASSSQAQQIDEQIDGSKTPQKISDRVAARQYFEMLAGKVEAGNLDLLALRIRQIGLPPQDVAIFNALAHEYYQEKTRLLKIDSNGDRFVDAADGKISSLLAGLSESSRKQFFAFLQGEKRGMNISPYDIGLSASVRLKPPVGDGHVHLTSVAYHPGQPQPMPFGMTPNYSSYMPTGTIDSNHNYYAELDLSGNTINCTMSQCFQNVHQGRVTLTIGSYGGTAYGSYVAPASWLSVQKYFNFPHCCPN